MDIEVNIDPLLASFFPVVETVASQFGKNCEVALHDLSRPQSSLIAISGSITKRAVGAPITNYVLNLIREHGNAVKDSYHYFSSTNDGRKLKSSTTFIRNLGGQVIGCLCINLCLDGYIKFGSIIEDLCSISDESSEKDGEHYGGDICDMVNNILETVLGKKKYQIVGMDRADKLEIVRELENKGLFLVKGTVELVAGRLDISKFTLYSYIDEIKTQTE